jgi:hypothetical protein
MTDEELCAIVNRDIELVRATHTPEEIRAIYILSHMRKLHKLQPKGD